jgi:hypothetical protein
MKKTINTISALILALILTFSFISYQNIQVKAESNNPYNTVTFNLSNPNAQSFKVIENGEEVTYFMSAEILPQTREHLPIGSFNRNFYRSDSNFTMQARFAGSVNPYVTRVTSVSDGRFNCRYGQFIRERYTPNLTYLNNNTGAGEYSVDYTTQYGTYTVSLFLWIVPSSNGGEANLTFVTGI